MVSIGLVKAVTDSVLSLGLPPLAMLLAIVAFYLILGCFLRANHPALRIGTADGVEIRRRALQQGDVRVASDLFRDSSSQSRSASSSPEIKCYGSPVGAVCPNWARTDLCGGREVTRVPTAKVVGTWPNRRE